MVTNYDERIGLVKTDWSAVRDRVLMVEPQFAKLVDAINPDKDYSIYMAYYPYGATEADTISSIFPDQHGGYFRLSKNEAPKDVFKNLGYGADSSPLGMVLEKQLESYIDLPKDKITIPWLIYTPGKFFPFNRVLSYKSQHAYAPNGLLSSTAGVRSIFMLANVGCYRNHSHLQRDFGITEPVPKNLYDQWAVFKNISNNHVNQNGWRCCVLYFSEKWIAKLHSDDPFWFPLKKYLHELAWQHYAYERNRVYFDICFSLIQKNCNLKPNPYLVDTAKHLFAIAMGAAPGFIPALNEEAAPINLIQTAYLHYGLKKYYPSVMIPSYFNFEKDRHPSYYSLQNPSTYIFSPKSRDVSSTLLELRELEHITKIFIKELSKNQALCSDTILGEIAKQIQFHFFHNKIDRHGIVKLTQEITERDKRFYEMSHHQLSKTSMNFTTDSTFLRGCISISRK